MNIVWFHKSSLSIFQVIHETQLLCVSGMSTALLTMFIDCCRNLPVSVFLLNYIGLKIHFFNNLFYFQNARSQSKPDPYLTINVGKKTENTSVQLRTSDPVYEIGYSFLVGNPENDTIHFKVSCVFWQWKINYLNFFIDHSIQF